MKITASFRFLIVAVLILSAVLVSCGGGEQSTTASGNDVATEAPATGTTEVGDVVEFPEIPFE